jgi:hypothetical protein
MVNGPLIHRTERQRRWRSNLHESCCEFWKLIRQFLRLQIDIRRAETNRLCFDFDLCPFVAIGGQKCNRMSHSYQIGLTQAIWPSDWMILT